MSVYVPIRGAYFNMIIILLTLIDLIDRLGYYVSTTAAKRFDRGVRLG